MLQQKRSLSAQRSITMDDNYRELAAEGEDYDNPSFEPVSSFGFAYNDPRWSDRELRLIVRSEFSGASLDTSNSRIDIKCGVHADPEEEEEFVDDDGNIYDQFDAETLKIPVNSVILAKESPFFRSLFGGNGFRDSNSHTVDIHINPEERCTFHAMIECMYTNSVSLTEVEEFISLWGLSERFLVHNCSQLCLRRLRDMPLDLDQAIRIHEAAYNSNPSGDLRSVIEASTHFLIRHFKKLSFVNSKPNSKHTRESNKELLRDFVSLAQSALRALLASDDLEVEREEIAFYALILWVKENTFSVAESQLMMTQLAPLIRFPFMKPDVLSGLIEYPELASPTCQELVIQALKFRTATEDMKNRIRSDGVNHRRFEKRSGYLKPVNCLILEQPKKQAIIHFDTSPAELESLEPSGHLTFEGFRVAGNIFAFQIHQVFTASTKKKVGLDLRMCSSTAGRVQVELNISVWSVPLMMFVHRFHAKHTFQVENPLLRCVDLFGKDLTELLAEKSQWVCDGRIFLNAELSIRS
ncbi:hypothetical protein Mapa_013619 [Marchantia paleacea]|nr:hypothetical protein Mapa_013619 [Marchantia paleacea]